MIDWWRICADIFWWNAVCCAGWTTYFGATGQHSQADVLALSCLIACIVWWVTHKRRRRPTVMVNRPTAERLAEWKVNFWADIEITTWGMGGDAAEETRAWFMKTYYDGLVKRFKELGYD